MMARLTRQSYHIDRPDDDDDGHYGYMTISECPTPDEVQVTVGDDDGETIIFLTQAQWVELTALAYTVHFEPKKDEEVKG